MCEALWSCLILAQPEIDAFVIMPVAYVSVPGLNVMPWAEFVADIDSTPPV